MLKLCTWTRIYTTALTSQYLLLWLNINILNLTQKTWIPLTCWSLSCLILISESLWTSDSLVAHCFDRPGWTSASWLSPWVISNHRHREVHPAAVQFISRQKKEINPEIQTAAKPKMQISPSEGGENYTNAKFSLLVQFTNSPSVWGFSSVNTKPT